MAAAANEDRREKRLKIYVGENRTSKMTNEDSAYIKKSAWRKYNRPAIGHVENDVKISENCGGNKRQWRRINQPMA
jgi:hypothetical protein